MRYLHCIAALALCLGATGCHTTTGSPANANKSPGSSPGAGSAATSTVKPVTVASDADLLKMKVNEAGQVPILEYHNIRVGRTNYDRTPEAFRNDLETLYREGYRPVSLHDYIDNKIDVPLGMTPVVFTFDDSSPTQFRYKEDGSLDPDCAFAILKTFHEAHPDFGMKAIFFMNASPTGSPSPVFGDQSTAEKKVKELLAAGMEIGNHTVTHPNLKKLSDDKVQKELADCVAGVHKLAPDAVVDTLALPFGVSPKNKELAEEGESGGVKYHNRAVLLVGANPAPAPGTVKFNPLRLPRIQAYAGLMGSDQWLASFQSHPKMRYISDGDPATVTVPQASVLKGPPQRPRDNAKIDPTQLGAAKLRTYSPETR